MKSQCRQITSVYSVAFQIVLYLALIPLAYCIYMTSWWYPSEYPIHGKYEISEDRFVSHTAKFYDHPQYKFFKTTLDLETGSISRDVYTPNSTTTVIDDRMYVVSLSKREIHGDYRERFLYRISQYSTPELDLLNYENIESELEAVFIGERYLVAKSPQKLEAIDISDPTLRWPIESQIPQSNQTCLSIRQTNCFVLVELDPDAMTSRPIRCELYKIDRTGPHPIANWQIYPHGFPQLSHLRDQIYSVDPNGKSVEIRSLDGRVLKTLSIPHHFGLEKLPIWVDSDSELISIPDSSYTHKSYYDLTTMDCLGEFYHGDMVSRDIKRGRLYLFDKSHRRLKIENERSKTNIAVVPLTARDYHVFHLDNGDIVAISAENLLDTEIIDVEHASIKQSFRPLQWFPALFYGSIVMSTLWGVSWLHCSARWSWTFAWVDTLFLGSLMMIALLCRLCTCGSLSALLRPEFNLMLGVRMAGLALTIVWLVFGKTRWTIRFIPLFGIVVASTLVMFEVWGPKNEYTAYGLSEILHVCCGTLTVLLVLRGVGVRLAQYTKELIQDQPQLQDKISLSSRAISISDLFLLTMLLAVMLGVSRNIPIRILTSYFVAPVNFLSALTLVATLITGIVCALGPRHLFVRLPVMCLLTFVYIHIHYFFHEGRMYEMSGTEFYWNYLCYLHISATASVFVFTMPYRMRGWRIYLPDPRLWFWRKRNCFVQQL